MVCIIVRVSSRIVCTHNFFLVLHLTLSSCCMTCLCKHKLSSKYILQKVSVSYSFLLYYHRHPLYHFFLLAVITIIIITITAVLNCTALPLAVISLVILKIIQYQYNFKKPRNKNAKLNVKETTMIYGYSMYIVFVFGLLVLQTKKNQCKKLWKQTNITCINVLQ